MISKYKVGAAMLGMTLTLGLTSCDDLFEPAIENHLGFDYAYEHPDYADGVLGNAYTRLPNGSYSFNDVATDDAVSNDVTNSYRKMTGVDSWTSNSNPIETWRNCRAAIQYINLFLANVDKVNWNSDQTIRDMYHQRYVGEARGLRALFMYYLLRAHGGYDAQGNLLGVPIILEPTTVTSDFNTLEVRASFADCMKQLIEDAEEAVRVLPVDYENTDNETETVNCFGKTYTVSMATYNRVLGTNFSGRFSGRIARAVLAQAALLAASPAYADGSGVTYEQAAKYAKAVLDLNGGLAGLAADGLEWYADPNMKDLQGGECPKEVMWRTEKSENNSLETDNYPPSIYGNGRINPTQNLVDAFPMANGYPISDVMSGYDPNNPYSERDPRLAKYIIFNGQTAGSGSSVINTQADNSANLDGLNKDVSKSTRTGYYMKKLLRQDINLDPNVNSKQNHYTARIRYTELYLDYAEAANEAYGPKGGTGYSAYDVIKAIRQRAGLMDINGEDGYLEQCATSKEKMRELIRNERRIELCFEGFRFWDLRRWKADIKQEAKGISITNSGAGKKYEVISVETRNFKDNGYYGPVPYDQILNFPSLVQNAGW
ncbi:MAG: RagB/SusD family nutrient uptake outer membrane protein [bacterium]|nr:RagB/SusD family nutrient uptake outer membrane protein [bacterium]